MSDLASRVAAYAAYYEAMTPANVGALRALVTADVHFKDPFNDVRGVEHMERCLASAFKDATDVRFQVLDTALSGRVAYLRWRFWCKPRRLNLQEPWVIDGMSEVRFDEAGLVMEHLDHWDAGAQFYARLPLLGAVIRWVAKRLKVG